MHYTLKHPGQRDPEKGPSGSDRIPGHGDPEFGKLSADLTTTTTTKMLYRLTQLWVIFRGKWADFRVIVDPELSLTPNGPFPGHV